MLGFELHSDGKSQQNLCLGYDGSQVSLADGKHTVTSGAYKPISMNGREVYKFATREVPAVLEEALANAGLGVEEVDWLLLHQANIRIMEVCAACLHPSIHPSIHPSKLHLHPHITHPDHRGRDRQTDRSSHVVPFLLSSCLVPSSPGTCKWTRRQ